MSSIEQRNKELKKHVATIHSANAISLLQRKISNALLFHAYSNLLIQEEHVITIRQLAEIIDFGGNNLQRIKDALKGLISIVLEWNVIDNITGEEDWTASTILASANIKGSKCTYAYSPAMRRLLYVPSIYGKISMSIQAKFQSSYGLALYENCVRYKGLPYTKWFSLDVFRKLMGVSPKTYLIFRDLKRRVIDCAVQEVNKYSEINVEYEFQKESREVKSIRFKLKEKNNIKQSNLNEIRANKAGEQTLHHYNENLETKLSSYGLSSSQINEFKTVYSPEYIEGKINYIESTKTFRRGKIEELGAYLVSALEKNYLPSKSSQHIRSPQELEKQQQEKKYKDEEEKLNEIKQKYSQYLLEYTEKLISEQSKANLEIYTEEFKNYLINKNDRIVLNKLNKEGTTNKIVKAYFRVFLKNAYPSIFKDILDFESYYENCIKNTTNYN